MLTAQQEAFAQALASGESQAEAYRIAYPRSRQWTPAHVHEQASKLVRHPKIAPRVTELRAPIVEAMQITQEERIRRYAALAAKAESVGDLNTAIRAEDSLTKVAGLFTTDRPNDRSPVQDLTAPERDAVRKMVEAAIERAREPA